MAVRSRTASDLDRYLQILLDLLELPTTANEWHSFGDCRRVDRSARGKHGWEDCDCWSGRRALVLPQVIVRAGEGDEAACAPSARSDSKNDKRTYSEQRVVGTSARRSSATDSCSRSAKEVSVSCSANVVLTIAASSREGLGAEIPEA